MWGDRDLVIAHHACYIFDQNNRVVYIGPPGWDRNLHLMLVAGAFHAQAGETIVNSSNRDWHAQVRTGSSSAQAENPAFARSGILIDGLSDGRAVRDFGDQVQCAAQRTFEHQIGIRASLKPIRR